MAEFCVCGEDSRHSSRAGQTISLGEKRIALFNVDGAFYAVDDTCLHRGGSLGEGELEGCIVTCRGMAGSSMSGAGKCHECSRSGEPLPNPSRCTRCMRNRRPRHAKAYVRLARSQSLVPDLI